MSNARRVTRHVPLYVTFFDRSVATATRTHPNPGTMSAAVDFVSTTDRRAASWCQTECRDKDDAMFASTQHRRAATWHDTHR